MRIPDKDDNRFKRLYLTRKGRGSIEGLIGITKKTLGEARTGISDDEVILCKKVLHQITRNLKNF